MAAIYGKKKHTISHNTRHGDSGRSETNLIQIELAIFFFVLHSDIVQKNKGKEKRREK